MLEVDGLFKRLGHTVVVRDVRLALNAHERVAIRGPNGAGKSTLLQIIAGVLQPDRGVITWNGKPLTGKERRHVGYVPEAADPPGHLTVGELLHLIAATKSCEPCSRELVERLELEELFGARISELSLGQRRRVCLAAALTGNPGLLLLDEPTNGLDPAAIDMLVAILTEDSARTILLVTHDQDFASQVATRQLAMRDGGLTA